MEERRPGQHPARDERRSTEKTAARTTPLAPPETEPAPTAGDRERIERARKPDV